MSTWKRWTRVGRKLLPETPRLAPPSESPPLDSDTAPLEAPTEREDERPPGVEGRGLSGWVEERAQRVVKKVYESHAHDLEERARRTITSVYSSTADDLEERAVRAMRKAIEAEADRIKAAIEHGIAVKKREVRLSLLVLVVSSLVYLALYWFTSRPDAS